MSPLSELSINLLKSQTSIRLIFLGYLVSIIFVAQSSIYFCIKIALTAIIVAFLIKEYLGQSNYEQIQQIEYIGNEWILVMSTNRKQKFIHAHILIDNVLFMLIQFKNPEQKKLIVLFHDQLSTQDLRLITLKTKLD